MSRPPLFRGFLDPRELIADHRARFEARVRRADGDACWEWTGARQKRRDGTPSYGYFSMGRRGVRMLAHRAAWIIEHGREPEGGVVRHDCDNVICVRPDHLLEGTQAQNLADMRERGRAHFNVFPEGQAHPNVKMDPDKVRALRLRAGEGATMAELGTEFGIHPSSAHDIARGKTWGHVG